MHQRSGFAEEKRLESLLARSNPGRDFAWLWAAQGTSEVGARVGDLALPLLAVLALQASPAQVGLLAVARWIPFVFLALPLGVVVDRRRRRPLLVAAELGRAALTLLLVCASMTGLLGLSLLLVLVLAIGACTVLFEVSYQSFLPALVGRDGLESANSRLAATAATAQVAGPGLAGLLVQVVSAPGAVLVNFATYASSAFALSRIRAVEGSSPGRDRRFLPDLRQGLAFVLRDRYLTSLAGFSGIYNFFAQWIAVLTTVYAVRNLGLTAFELGVSYSVGAVGAVAGASMASPMTRRFGAGPLLLACATIECVVLTAIPLTDARWGHGADVAVLAACFTLNGAGTALSSVVALTLRQLRTPNQLLGRVNASMRWISYGTIAVGAALGGLAGQVFGAQVGLYLGSGGILLTVAWVACSPLPKVGDPRSLMLLTTPAGNASPGPA